MKILLCVFACIAAAAAHGFGHSSFYLQSHPVHAHFPPATVVAPSFTPVVRSHLGFPYFKHIAYNFPNTVSIPNYPIAFKPSVYSPPAGFPFGHVPFVIQFVPVDGKNDTKPMEKPDDDDEKATEAPAKEDETDTPKPTEAGEDDEETTDRAVRSSEAEKQTDAEILSDDADRKKRNESKS